MSTGRRENPKFYRIICVLTLIAMLVLTLPVFAQESESAEKVDVVILKQDVDANTKLTAEHLEIKTFLKKNIPENIISSMGEAIGMCVSIKLYAGEYVSLDHLLDTVTVDGMQIALYQPIETSSNSFVNVTDYFPANSDVDVSDFIQQIIDKNPQRTIYFPDGEYLISKPIRTQSDPEKTSSIYLSEGAVIKAIKDKWKSMVVESEITCTALVCMGGRGDFANARKQDSNKVNGSYFFVMGGTLDGNGVADGLAMEQCREALVRNVCIKNFKHIGLNVPRPTNSFSAEITVEDVVIVGNGSVGTIGLSLGPYEGKSDAYDNTVTNLRVYDCETGMLVNSGGNLIKDIRVYYTDGEHLAQTLAPKYDSLIGINDICGGNFYANCYVENYATGMSIVAGSTIMDMCSVKWTINAGDIQTAFVVNNGTGTTYLSACSADFYDESTKNTFLSTTASIKLEAPIVDTTLLDTQISKANIKSGHSIVPIR